MLPSVQAVSGRTIAAAAAAWILAIFAVNALVFQGAFGTVLWQLHAQTHGLVEPTLVGSLIVLAAFMMVVVVLARVPPAAVGWVPGDAARALPVVIGFWVLMQAALVLSAIAFGGGVTLHPAWTQPGTAAVLGGVLAQALGNALAEETAFRGFFFAQFLLRTRRLRPAAAVATAAAASAVLFAVAHLPNRLLVKQLSPGSLATDQAQLVFAGLLFALVFAATRNLFTTVGLHALANDPAPLVSSAGEVVQVTYLVLLGTVLLTARGMRSRNHLAPSGRHHGACGA